MNEQLQRELNFLEDRAAEVRQSNFILAEKKLSGVLQAIAKSPFLCKLIGTCTQGYNYAGAFAAAFQSAKDGRVYASGVSLPKSPKERVALVFCLLMEIDAGEREFYPFLNEYFPGDGSYFESFQAFLTEVFNPFTTALLSLSHAVVEGGVEKEVPAANVFLTEAAMRAVALIKEDQERFTAAKYLDGETLRDLGELAGGLIAALETQEGEFIRLTFIGYKYGVRVLKKEGNLQKIKKLLEGAGWL